MGNGKLGMKINEQAMKMITNMMCNGYDDLYE